jgi:hypothetical protein
MLKFDPIRFFEGFKKRFDDTLDQSQVDGINFLLEHFENEPLWNSIPRLSYAWATIFHETAGSMQPVEEAYYIGEKYGVKRMREIQKGFRYYPFFGRGFVQLTWETRRIPNYSKATREIKKQRPEIVKEFEAKTGQTFDLVKNPDQAKDPIIAFAVMSLGMFQGWFTGAKISTFIDNSKADYVNARTVINGHDKAGQIATHAKNFEKILRESYIGRADTIINRPAENSAANDPSPGGTEDSPEVPLISQAETIPSDPAPPTTPTTQIAETIVNTGEQAAAPVPGEPITLTAPAADNATSKSVKATIFGIGVPTFIYTGFKSIEEAIAKGYISAAEIGSAAMNFVSGNFKWIAGGIALYIALQIVKKLVKQITFWISMITHAVPAWNSVKVQPRPIAPAPPSSLRLIWNALKSIFKSPAV